MDKFSTMSLFAYKYKKVIDLEMRLFIIDFGVWSDTLKHNHLMATNKLGE